MKKYLFIEHLILISYIKFEMKIGCIDCKNGYINKFFWTERILAELYRSHKHLQDKNETNICILQQYDFLFLVFEQDDFNLQNMQRFLEISSYVGCPWNPFVLESTSEKYYLKRGMR